MHQQSIYRRRYSMPAANHIRRRCPPFRHRLRRIYCWGPSQSSALWRISDGCRSRPYRIMVVRDRSSHGESNSASENQGIRAGSAHTHNTGLGVGVPSLAITAKWMGTPPVGYTLADVLLVFTALLAPAITVLTIVDAQREVAMSLRVIVGPSIYTH